MPDRWVSRCSTVTSSAISGRSLPRTERAVVARSSTPASISDTTASAVSPLAPLASANCVSTVFGTPCARSAWPKAFASSTSPSRSTWTTPEKPVRRASWSTASGSDGIEPAIVSRRASPGRVDLRQGLGRLVAERRLHLRREPLEEERCEEEHRAGDDERHRACHRRQEGEVVEEELAEGDEEQGDAADAEAA